MIKHSRTCVLVLCSWQRPSGPNVLHRIELVLRMILWNSFAVPLELSFCMSLYSHTLYLRMVIGILRIQYIIGLHMRLSGPCTANTCLIAACNVQLGVEMMRRLQHWFNCMQWTTQLLHTALPITLHHVSTYIHMFRTHCKHTTMLSHRTYTAKHRWLSKAEAFPLLHTPFTLWLSTLNISLVSVPDTHSGSTADTHYTGEWEWSDTQWKWKAIHYNPSKLHFMGFLSFLSLHPWT